MTRDASRRHIGMGLLSRVAGHAVAVRRFLLNPRIEGEDDRRREYILNVILLGSIVMLLVMEGVTVWYAVHPTGRTGIATSFISFSIFPAFAIGLYALSRRGFVRVASYVFVLALFFGNLYAVYRWGVNVPTAVAAHALIIVIASILLGTRFGFAMTGAIAAAVMVLWYVQSQGIVLTDEEFFTSGDAVALALVYGVVMVVSSLSNREIERSLSRVRQSERELKEERDLLEVRVDERTRDFQEAQFGKVENIHRLAEFGELASGLFHDLINLVTAVLPRADVKEATGDPATFTSRANEIETLTDRVKDFTDGMRRQLREKANPELFSIDEVIVQAMHLLSYEARREKVQLMFDGSPSARIFGDPFRFHHIATNLISNAIESYRSVADAREKIVRISIREADRSIMMVVRDKGCGIPDNVKKKIFEPFFTMKVGGNGLGIGLAVVKRIVERDFGGTIDVASVVGQGSTFIVVVPTERSH